MRRADSRYRESALWAFWRRCDPGVVRTEAATYDISWKADGTSDEPADGRGSVSFEGNAQAFRLVTKLHFLVDERGMNLTYALLSTIVKYPVPSTGIDLDSGDIKTRKMGYYLADEKMFREIERETGTNGCRHPLTFILEAADDIAYKTADIEDAFVKGT